MSDSSNGRDIGLTEDQIKQRNAEEGKTSKAFVQATAAPKTYDTYTDSMRGYDSGGQPVPPQI